VTFPFTAIVGQDEMLTAIIAAAIEPKLSGVLIFGDRGTGKSTAIRALAALLPPMQVVAGCPYNCDPAENFANCPAGCPARSNTPHTATVAVPVVDLPLGATEDRLVGALNLERALTAGEKVFEPGLLARANRGFLYIDEANLLEDYLVDLLLDVAASGENVVEREGISIRHPARFVLVGSGNPEEGELRPQLLDRFGLSVEVSTPQDIPTRVDVVRRRDAYDQDPAAFTTGFAAADATIREKILAARAGLRTTRVPDEILTEAATICQSLGTDGLRGELTLIRAARALAALEGRAEVTSAELRAVAPSALRHRLRRDPLDEAGSTVRVDRALQDYYA